MKSEIAPSKEAPPIRTLSALKPGEEGIIQSIETAPEVVLKFLERGMGPGEKVKFIRTSPFGDPIEIEVMNYRLALRKSEADKIILSPVAR